MLPKDDMSCDDYTLGVLAAMCNVNVLLVDDTPKAWGFQVKASWVGPSRPHTVIIEKLPEGNYDVWSFRGDVVFETNDLPEVVRLLWLLEPLDVGGGAMAECDSSMPVEDDAPAIEDSPGRASPSFSISTITSTPEPTAPPPVAALPTLTHETTAQPPAAPAPPPEPT
jgi:hypothetical protein